MFILIQSKVANEEDDSNDVVVNTNFIKGMQIAKLTKGDLVKYRLVISLNCESRQNDDMVTAQFDKEYDARVAMGNILSCMKSDVEIATKYKIAERKIEHCEDHKKEFLAQLLKAAVS